MKIIKPHNVNTLEELIEKEEEGLENLKEKVKEIVNRVKVEGDRALIEYTRIFDKWDGEPLECPKEELRKAWEELTEREQKAILTAKKRIEEFHKHQLERSWFLAEKGSIIGTIVNPVERAGLYVPGGLASLPSTALMTVIPAKVAQVREVIVVTPTPNGFKNKYTLGALYISEADRVFFVGGAQAIAALAYGTESIPKVDVIAGPGNIYVSLAKALVYGDVGIDSVAGPSEIMVVTDGSFPARWVAIDLLSQAEHDEMAKAILISISEDFIREVIAHIEDLLKELPTQKTAKASWEKRGIVIKVDSLMEAVDIVNKLAPEHLELLVENGFELLPHIRNAGAIFIGGYSPEAMGDYIVGCNHTLPTGRRARFSSPLGVYNFLKKSSVISLSKELFFELAHEAMLLAEIEGLIAHRDSVKIRIEGRDK